MSTVLHSAANGTHPAMYIQSGDPGAVGAAVWWADTTAAPPTLKYRNTGNSAWVFGTGPIFPAEFAAPDLKVTGVTGAATAARLVGANSSGAPASGTFVAGDLAVDLTGKLWVCTVPGTPGTWAASGGSSLYSAYLCYQDQETSGTSAGTFTSGAWRTRVLNTEVADTGGFGSVASNQITLAAGTYRVQAMAPAEGVDRHALRLQNITDSSTILPGQSSHAKASSVVSNYAMLVGRFTIAGTKVIELQHRCETTGDANSLGVPTSLATEIYACVELFKE